MKNEGLVHLAEYPDISSFNSCFRCFGRKILPPLITAEKREEINNFRTQAILIETTLKKQKEEKEEEKLLNIVQDIIDTVIEVQNDVKNNVDEEDGYCNLKNEHSEMANLNISSPITTIDAGPKISYEEIVHTDESRRDETFTISSHHRNAWIEHSPSDKENPVKESSQSMSVFTVIDKNQYVGIDSDIPSSNQSTDLDKYLDISTELEQVSSSSTASEKSPDIPDTVISIGDSVDTLENSSRTITPVLHSCNENLDTSSINLSNTILPSDKVERIPTTDCFPFDENKTEIPVTNHPKSWLSKVLNKSSLSAKEMSKSTNDLVDKKSSNLIRSHSYTLISPSPVLLMSHLGCQCMKCPEFIMKPHCQSLKSENLSIEAANSEIHHSSLPSDCRKCNLPQRYEVDQSINEKNLSSNTSELKEVEYPSATEDSPQNSNVVELNSNKSDVSLSSGYPLPKTNLEKKSATSTNEIEFVQQELYKKFIELREKTLSDLQVDQLRQIEAVKEKFDKKEQELRGRLSSLSLSTSKDLEFTSKLPHSNFVPFTPPPSNVERNKHPSCTSSCNSSHNDVFSTTSSCCKEGFKQFPSTSSSNKKCRQQFSLYHKDQSNELSSSPVQSTSSVGEFLSISPYKKEQMSDFCITPSPKKEEENDTQFISNSKFSPISEMRSYIANNNAVQAQRALEEKLKDPLMKKKFEKVSAFAKGFLTRLLWKSLPVQDIINSIKDAAQEMTDIRQNLVKCGRAENPSKEDLEKQKVVFERVLYMDQTLDYIFFGMSTKQRMQIISETREHNKKRETYSLPPTYVTQRVKVPSPQMAIRKHKLSSATLKSLERKKLSSINAIDIHVSKKPLHSKIQRKKCTHITKQDGIYRKRILSPRSCPISPPSLKHKYFVESTKKENKESGKVRRALY